MVFKARTYRNSCRKTVITYDSFVKYRSDKSYGCPMADPGILERGITVYECYAVKMYKNNL